jgi:hypothetical protein
MDALLITLDMLKMFMELMTGRIRVFIHCFYVNKKYFVIILDIYRIVRAALKSGEKNSCLSV